MKPITQEKVCYVLKWLLERSSIDSSTVISQSAYLHTDCRFILFDDFSDKYYKEELEKPKGDWSKIQNGMKYIYNILIDFGLMDKCVGALFMGGTDYYLIDGIRTKYIGLDLPDWIFEIIDKHSKELKEIMRN